MAEFKYVDWDGLVYYDSKSKQYIADKLGDCVKMGGHTSFDTLPSPSFQNVNYIYKVTNEFTSNDYFEKPGYVYKAGTWVQVTDLNGVYLYTIFNEEDTSPSIPIDPGTPDLTDYYTKSEVDTIIEELPTKEYVDQAIVDALNDVEIDVTGLVTKEEFDVVQHQAAVHDVKLMQIDSDLVDINQRIDGIVVPDLTGYATESFVAEKISEIDIPSTDGLATETFVHEMIAKAELEDKEADLEAYYTKDQVNALIPDVSNFATKDELPSVDGFATTDYVDSKIAEIVHPTVDLEGYATEDWVNEQGFIKEVPEEFVTESELDAKGYLTSHQSLEDYAKKTDIPDVSEFLTSIPDEYVTTDELSEYALKQDIPTDYLKEIPDEYITESELNERGYLTEHQDISSKLDVSVYEEDKKTFITDVSDKADKEHTHSLSDIEDYVAPDLDKYALRSEIPTDYLKSVPDEYITEDELNAKGFSTFSGSYNDLTDKPEFITDDTLESKGYVTESDLGDYAKSSDLENLATKDELPKDYLVADDLVGYSKFSGSYNDLTDKPIIPSVDGFITMEDVRKENYLTSIPEEYITEDELRDKGFATTNDLESKADAEHIHSYNALTDKPMIPSIDGLATEQYVDDAISNIDIPTVDTSKFVTSDALGEALGAKANDVLFTDDYRVGTPIGLFAQDDPVQGLTITEIITRILGLTLYVPDVPENVPEATPEYVKEIISDEMHAYTLDGSGTDTFIEAETDSFYKQMTPEESYEKSTENFFYQILDPDTNTLLESGYQIKTVEDEEAWLTVAIPSTVTNFHVEQFNQLASGDDKWVRVTGFTLVPNDDQPLDGYTVYSADNFDGGITIRIVID